MTDKGRPTSINFRQAILKGNTSYGLTMAQLIAQAQEKQAALAELRVAVSRLDQEKVGGLKLQPGASGRLGRAKRILMGRDEFSLQ